MNSLPSEHIIYNARVLSATGHTRIAAILLKRAGCSLEATLYLLFGK